MFNIFQTPPRWLGNIFKAIWQVKFPAGSSNTDLTERVRVANSHKTFQDIQTLQLDTNNWEQLEIGGGTVNFAANEPFVELSVGIADGDEASNQSNLYLPYNPGDTQVIKLTNRTETPKDNLYQEIMLGDDNNGLGFKIDSQILKFFERSSTSGAPVDIEINQLGPLGDGVDGWNLDPLDGTGPSGITLEPNKIQFFIMRFLYLGVGPVQWGFIIEDEIIWCHCQLHANILESPYMANPNLPIRYTIRNDGVTASPSTLRQLCSAIESEGGRLSPGNKISTPVTWADLRTIPATTRTPIVAIRLTPTLNGKPNTRTFRILDAHNFADDSNTVIQIGHLHKPSGIVATWNPIGDSGLEFSTDITAVVGNPEHIIDGTIIPAAPGVGKGGNSVLQTGDIDAHAFISQNRNFDNSQIFAVQAEGQGVADVLAGLTGLVF
jgi:hypothetical protein